MAPVVRKVALVAHVAASVAWLGAVLAFLVLSLAGIKSTAAETVRAAYIAMNLIGWCLIVPLSLASLVTGLIQSLGTTWGLFRHYWVVAKFGITVVASLLLLVHMQIASRMAEAATGAAFAAGDFRAMRIQLVADAAAAVVVLLIATALSVFKPQGLTPYGRRELGVERAPAGWTLPWGRILGILVVALIAFALVKHLTGGGLHHR